jgi:hypothetical protein
VPGNYFDALNRNTKLGKAVAAAVEELDHLNDMVRARRLAMSDPLEGWDGPGASGLCQTCSVGSCGHAARPRSMPVA